MSAFGVFLVRIFLHLDWIRRDTPYLSVFSPNAGNYGPEKLRIQTLFTQCLANNWLCCCWDCMKVSINCCCYCWYSCLLLIHLLHHCSKFSTLHRFHKLFQCLHCWFWASKYDWIITWIMNCFSWLVLPGVILIRDFLIRDFPRTYLSVSGYLLRQRTILRQDWK